MNKRAILIQRNNVARLLEPHSKRERNVVRINTGNSLKHELAKFYLNFSVENKTGAALDSDLSAEIANNKEIQVSLIQVNDLYTRIFKPIEEA